MSHKRIEDRVSISLVGCRYETLFKTILPQFLVLHSDIFLVGAFCFEQDKMHLLEDIFMYSVDMSEIPYRMHTSKECTMNSSASSLYRSFAHRYPTSEDMRQCYQCIKKRQTLWQATSTEHVCEMSSIPVAHVGTALIDFYYCPTFRLMRSCKLGRAIGHKASRWSRYQTRPRAASCLV